MKVVREGSEPTEMPTKELTEEPTGEVMEKPAEEPVVECPSSGQESPPEGSQEGEEEVVIHTFEDKINCTQLKKTLALKKTLEVTGMATCDHAKCLYSESKYPEELLLESSFYLHLCNYIRIDFCSLL